MSYERQRAEIMGKLIKRIDMLETLITKVLNTEGIVKPLFSEIGIKGFSMHAPDNSGVIGLAKRSGLGWMIDDKLTDTENIKALMDSGAVSVLPPVKVQGVGGGSHNMGGGKQPKK